MTAVTVKAIRAAEEHAVQCGDNRNDLMNRAGKAAATVIAAAFPYARRVVILCGKGNNGGDGFVAARHFYSIGCSVTVVLVEGTPTTAQSTEQFMTVKQLPISVSDTLPDEADLYIDAVYGIGFHGRLSDRVRPFLHEVNARAGHKAAIDIPSGLEADSGLRDPDTFRSELTVTFIAHKMAMLRPDCQPFLGRIVLEDIGVICDGQSLYTISEEDVQNVLTPRAAESHKGCYGRLLAVCGSYGMAGAAMLAGEAALRCGVGLLTISLPPSIYPIVAAALPEAVYIPWDDTIGNRPQDALKKASAVLIGCGCGISQTTTHVAAILERANCPVVLDADGINCAALHIDIRATQKRPVIVTPHPAEMARLLGCTTEQVQADRVGAATAFCEKSGAITVLKGYHTLIAAPGERVHINPTGNPGMATGGSGDVLAGMIASLAAQGIPPLEAAKCGVFLHGAAGDAAAAKLSQRSMLPRDIIEQLPSLLARFD